ncbi:MAG: hypothetical protein K2Q28_12055 [Hyphomicrobium sp.]|nr:hypothetical protein [Hyphomicrobium sp.]
MGRRADDDDVWADFELVLSRCAVSDPSKVRAKLAEYGLTVVRVTAIEHAGTMLRDTLKKKPDFKISFVPDPADPDSPAVAVDFATSQIEAEAKAMSALALYRERGATGWRIIGPDHQSVAIGP